MSEEPKEMEDVPYAYKSLIGPSEFTEPWGLHVEQIKNGYLVRRRYNEAWAARDADEVLSIIDTLIEEAGKETVPA